MPVVPGETLMATGVLRSICVTVRFIQIFQIASKTNIPYVGTSETSALSAFRCNSDLEEPEEKLLTTTSDIWPETKHYRAFHLMNDSLLFAFLETGDFTLNRI